MSGGSYNYLYRKLEADEIEDAILMVKRLEELGFHTAALQLRSFAVRPAAPQALVDLVKAVEWWDSSDWSYEDVSKAHDSYMEYLKKP